LFCLDLLSPAATLLLLLVYGPAGTTLTAFLWRDITWLDQALAALWCIAPGTSLIAWCLVVTFSLLPIRSRSLLEFLLFAALLFLFHGPAGSSSALAALLGIACGFVVFSPLVCRRPVCRWTFYRLLLLYGPAFTALAALLGIACGFVVFSPLVYWWAFCGPFLLYGPAFTALAALLGILGSLVAFSVPVCRWTFCRLFLS
jgi:hypothetical protein